MSAIICVNLENRKGGLCYWSVFSNYLLAKRVGGQRVYIIQLLLKITHIFLWSGLFQQGVVNFQVQYVTQAALI